MPGMPFQASTKPRPAFRFLVPFLEFNRILTWEEGSEEPDLPVKALKEWRRQVPLVRSYYLGSSPFLPYPGLQTRSPRQALEPFASFICLAEDGRLEWMALFYLLKTCHAFHQDYDHHYFGPAKPGRPARAYRRNPMARPGVVQTFIDLLKYDLVALNFLKLWSRKEPLGQEGMAAELSRRSREFAVRFLAAQPKELEAWDKLVAEHLGRYKDPETELLPLWDTWVAARILKRFRLMDEARRAKAEAVRNRWKKRQDERRRKAEEEKKQEGRQAEEAAKERESRGRKVRPVEWEKLENPRSLKAVHRRVLKLCHPDLGRNQADRERRHQWTVRANLAKENNDLKGLLKLLKELVER